MGVLVTKKGKKKESSAPVLDILEATVKVNAAEYLAAGDVVTKNDGSTFTVEKPHISCELEVVDTGPSAKQHIGTTWYERFYYPETEKGSGEYENRPGTKIGGLSEARYGVGFWITGTRVDHDTIRALPGQDDNGSRVEATNPEPDIPAPDFD
jgi:hypothetical protein